MITVITGAPGAGKTSHVVEKMLMPMAAKDWKESAVTAEGESVEVVRKLYTNIKGLLLEHELIGDEELASWPKWVKPGDFIVYDEVQKPWPLTGANVKQPECITELETHRHYGIDMILLTQHPMLVNSAIARLAGQHLHVRKLGNSRFATVYEWDGVSRTLLYKNAFAKRPWRRGKAVEKVYRSSSLHTKQKRAVPTVLFGLLFAIGLLAYLGPVVTSRISERVSGQSAVKTAASAPAKPSPGSRGASSAPVPALPPSGAVAARGGVPAPGLPASAPQLAMIGCARMANRCTCFDAQGEKADKPAEYCEEKTGVHLPAKLVTDQSLDWRVQPRKPSAEVGALMADGERLLNARRRGISTAALQGTGE
jgi:zona occludens toxin